MSSQNQISPEDFVAIAGNVSLEDAEKYLKMGKYNLELALNYFFNKVDKTIKPIEEPPKPLTVFQKIQEGGKKQAHYEKLVKELTTEPTTKYKKSNEVASKKPSKEAASKKQSIASTSSQIQSQKSSNAKGSGKSSDKKGVDSSQKKLSEIKTPDTKASISSFFGSLSKESKKPITPSTGVKEEMVEEIEENKFEHGNVVGKSLSMVIEDPFPMKGGFFEESNNSRIDFEDFKQHSHEEVKQLEEQVMSQFNRQSSVAADFQYNRSNGIEEEFPNENSGFAFGGSTVKNFKRNYMKFATMHEIGSKEKIMEGSENGEMVIEEENRLAGWSKLLGNMRVKACVVSSLKVNAQKGDGLELKLEKSTVPEKKKGPRSKAVPATPAIIRILYQNQELGKIETSYSTHLCPLIEREYVRLEASLEDLPASWATFASFWVMIKVHLLPKAISKPMTKVYSSEDNLNVEEEIILNELKHTQEAFINLFNSLGIKCITPSLVKKSSGKQSPILSQTKSSSKGKEEKKETAIDIENPSQSKGTDTNTNTNTNELASMEKELIQHLLNDGDFLYEDLEPLEIFHTLSLDLNPDYTRALTWMLLREGSNQKQKENLYIKKRILHPLWEEYQLQDYSILYFNPFTGQLCLELPKSSHDCSGGIVANMETQDRVEVISELMYANMFDKSMKNDEPKSSRKKVLTFSQGRNSLSNIMKGPLPPAKTLIIVPVNSLYFWDMSLTRLSRENNPTKLLVYYGQKRSQEFQNLGIFDIVLTTYGIISGEFTGDGKKDLFNYDWFRVVLDEAHYIKGRRIQTTKAIEELTSLHKWCLSTLTPQNKLEDLFNMVSFLKLEPWNSSTWWNSHLTKPLEKGDKGVVEILKTIVGPVMLNMTENNTKKANNSNQFTTPEKKYRIETVELLKKERDYYNCLFLKSKTEFDKVKGQDALMDYTQAFEIVVRIRHACDHLFLIYSKFEVRDSDGLMNEIGDFFGSKDNDEENQKKSYDELSIQDEKSLRDKFHDHFEILMEENTRTEQVIAIQKPQAVVSVDMIQETVERLNMGDIVHCPLCLNDLENAVITICGHILCNVCMRRSIVKSSMCPVCNTILTRKDCLLISRKISFSFDLSEKYRRSSKMESIMRNITEAIDFNKKCVVFSHFHTMVLLLEYDLEQNGINYLKIDSGMNEEERIMRIQEFNASPDLFVLLSTIVLGDIRNEKIITDIVIVTEPSNDFTLEEEAMKSIYTDQPTNEVEVVKFVCANTIEEKIIELGQKKKEDPEYRPGTTPEEKILECLEDLCSLMKVD